MIANVGAGIYVLKGRYLLVVEGKEWLTFNQDFWGQPIKFDSIHDALLSLKNTSVEGYKEGMRIHMPDLYAILYPEPDPDDLQPDIGLADMQTAGSA